MQVHKTIICLDCGSQETYYPVHTNTNPRRFCTECSRKRKYLCIQESNRSKPGTGNPIGRPPLKEDEEESISTWETSDSWY